MAIKNSLIFMFTSAVTADEKYFHILKTCQLIETGLQYDMQYRIQYHYNGQLQAEYNSSAETLVGFTDYGKQFADVVNKDPHYLQVRKHDLEYYCKIQVAAIYTNIKDKAGNQRHESHIFSSLFILFQLSSLR